MKKITLLAIVMMALLAVASVAAAKSFPQTLTDMSAVSYTR